MIKISVPASTTNLGPGFDVFGLSLDLYNVFTFDPSSILKFSGFKRTYSNENNLVYFSYKAVFERLHIEILPVHISLVREDVPISRGLGSSSTCIVAGVLAANHFLNNILSQEECLKICSDIEGHPDNVSAALLGGLVSSFIDEGMVHYLKTDVNPGLHFFALIPPFKVSTKKARQALKSKYYLNEITYTLSRAVHLRKAYETGDYELLYSLTKDKIHEPYRLPLIENGSAIVELVHQNKQVIFVSGSGSTLMVVVPTNSSIQYLYESDLLARWQVKELHPTLVGTQIQEVK